MKQRSTHCYKCWILLMVVGTAKADIPPLLAEPLPWQVLQEVTASRNAYSEAVSVGVEKEAVKQAYTDRGQDLAALKASIKNKLLTVRETGDQRLLGEAQQLLATVNAAEVDVELRILRASLWQSLHQFVDATTELKQVLRISPGNAQALLTLGAIYLAQGEYAAAGDACKALLGRAPALLSGGCASQVAARTGKAAEAYDRFHRLYLREQKSSATDVDVLHYARVTLAEMAEQAGNAEAAAWWQQALQLRPHDVYTRIGAANNAWINGRVDVVVALTELHNDVDALMILRTLALQVQGKVEADVLRERLLQRLEEARWRGDTLHARDQAWISLALKQVPEQALALAQLNWKTQREPEDTRLLLSAALAAQRLDIYADTKRWLDAHKQWHAYYPTPALAEADRP